MVYSDWKLCSKHETAILSARCLAYPHQFTSITSSSSRVYHQFYQPFHLFISIQLPKWEFKEQLSGSAFIPEWWFKSYYLLLAVRAPGGVPTRGQIKSYTWCTAVFRQNWNENFITGKFMFRIVWASTNLEQSSFPNIYFTQPAKCVGGGGMSKTKYHYPNADNETKCTEYFRIGQLKIGREWATWEMSIVVTYQPSLMLNTV